MGLDPISKWGSTLFKMGFGPILRHLLKWVKTLFRDPQEGWPGPSQARLGPKAWLGPPGPGLGPGQRASRAKDLKSFPGSGEPGPTSLFLGRAGTMTMKYYGPARPGPRWPEFYVVD